jgi:hypothetical protein
MSFLEKTPTKGIKRKASSNDKIPKKIKDTVNMPMLNPSKMSKSSVSAFNERPVDIFHLKLIYISFKIRRKKKRTEKSQIFIISRILKIILIL